MQGMALALDVTNCSELYCYFDGDLYAFVGHYLAKSLVGHRIQIITIHFRQLLRAPLYLLPAPHHIFEMIMLSLTVY